jgi:hypothetical protein
MHVGDIFAWKALSYIDPDNGGSVVEQPKTLAKAVATVKNVDTIINGHIPVGQRCRTCRRFAGFTDDFVGLCRAALKAGKSVEQAAKDYQWTPKVPRATKAERETDVRGASPISRFLQRAEEITDGDGHGPVSSLDGTP